jgi:hypothetical protein
MRTFLLEVYDFLYVYVSSSNWQQKIFIYKIISLIISLILLTFILILIFRIKSNIKKSFTRITESLLGKSLPGKTDKKWDSIIKKIEGEDEGNYKLAIIEADTMLDDVLKKIGFTGEDMGERLKQVTPQQISNIEEVWEAHKMRNKIAHQMEFRVSQSEAERAIEIYQRALEDLSGIEE